MSVANRISASQIRTYYAIRVPQLRQRGKQWRCWCPIHPKATRDSFSVNADTGQFTCHSCGATGDIVDLEKSLTGVDVQAALQSVEALVGLDSEHRPASYAPRQYDPDPEKLAQAQKKNGGNGHPKVIDAIYPYVDEREKLLFEVVRFRPKAFAQRRPDPENPGHYLWDLNGTRRVVFNLPKVISATTVYVVEGEKDALALGEIGLVATTAPGGAKKWRDEYDPFFKDKIVYIIPDSDGPGKEHAELVASHLLPVAKEVRIVELPVKDASDFLEYYSAEHLADLVATAPVVKREQPQAQALAPGPDGYWQPQGPRGQKTLEMARAVLAKKQLLMHCGVLYEYDGVVWSEPPKDMLLTYALAQDHPECVTPRRMSQTATLIEATLRRQQMPHWRNLEETEIAFANGVLDISTMGLRQHRKEDYLESVVPHDYTPGQRCDQWSSALRDWFGEDRQAIEKTIALQEFFGYVLMPHAKFKRALFLYGAPDTGKSVVEHILQRMVGENNYTHIPPDVMGDSRKIAPIKGKYLNTVSELNADAMMDDAGFKRLVSTGDAVQLDRKYKEPESYIPHCKHVIVSNVLPRINDLTMGTYNRLLVLAFDKIIGTTKRDPNLETKLRAEMPGILCWAVEGAARLAANDGRFTEPSDSRRIVAEHRFRQNPINDFLEEFCVVADDDEFIPLADLRKRYNNDYSKKGVSTNQIRNWLGNGRNPQYKLVGNKLYGWRWK